jgi:hypothetical protein
MWAARRAAYGRLMTKRLAVVAISILFLAFPAGTPIVSASIIWPCGNCSPNPPAS